MERIKTGVLGLDQILGGFPVGKMVLITGDAGTGKTVFGLQFAKECCDRGLKTIYIITEEDSNDLRFQGKSFGWNLENFEERGLLRFIELLELRARITEAEISIDAEVMKGDFAKLLNEVPENTDVVIIDSIGSYTAKLTPYEFRDRFDLLNHELKQRGITSMVIIDSATSQEFNELALFSAYGAIQLIKRENPYTGRRERVMDIIKMRSTKTPIQYLTYDITSNGIEITSPVESSD